jgi:hypothetical protein
MMMTKRITLLCIATIASTVLAGCAAWQSEPPAATTPDGLELTASDDFDVLYTRPDSDFSTYKTIFVAAPEVEFDDDWQRRQNSSDAHRVTDRDLETIRDMVSQQVVDVFSKEISEGTTYLVVDSAEEADLILKPTVTKLNIINPLNNQPYRITVLAENSGGMTLQAEISDRIADEVLLRFTDKKRGREYQDFRWQSSVRVKSENNRLLRAWAQSLNELISQETAPG